MLDLLTTVPWNFVLLLFSPSSEDAVDDELAVDVGQALLGFDDGAAYEYYNASGAAAAASGSGGDDNGDDSTSVVLAAAALGLDGQLQAPSSSRRVRKGGGRS